jgi:hypothetical protein
MSLIHRHLSCLKYALLFAILMPFTVPNVSWPGPSLDAMLVMPLQERQALADELYQQEKYRKAKKQYRILARLGSKHAQNRLATMNIDGLGMRRDVVQGWIWAALAAEFEHPEYSTLRDSSWTALSLDQREEAVERLQHDLLIFSDIAITRAIKNKARRKLRMQTIGYGMLPDGMVETWRVEGMAGDPVNPGNWENMLRSIKYQATLHELGGSVTLGKFKVLEPDASLQTEIDPHLEASEESKQEPRK